MTPFVNRIAAAGIAAMVASIGFAGLADADDNAIKYRQNHMKALAAHMGAISAVMKGEAGKPGHVAGHAAALASIGAMTGDLFPVGSGEGNTDALPAIWAQPGEFEKAWMALKDASANFAKVAAGGDMAATGGAINAVGKTCGGCHKSFRKKQ
ncbi:MAG: cytochrome c [Rhodospirillales bacterium]|nr:cytochrome c [Rhodospirillales bacterium]